MKKIEKSLLLVLVLTVFTTSYAYADNMAMNDSMMHNNMTNGMMKDQIMTYPLKQIKHGVLVHDVKCKTGFTLILKSSDGSPACVKNSSVNVLVMRGWAMNEDSMMKIMNQNMTSIQHMMNQTMAMNKMENKSMTETMSGGKMKMPNESPQMSQSSMESKYPDAPALVGITDYINTTPAKLAQEMKGNVVVYDFWTFNCINCIHTLPHVVDLNNKYQDKGVLVIGIHSPETFVEKDPNNVREAVQKYNIKYPVVIDSEFQTWNAFGNHYWPHIYIADAQGKLRYNHIGEGAYDEIDNTVASLLLEHENQKPKELVMG
ncbi:MAG: redoxin domain-containing protein [Nitrosopumilaceae archaeon]